MARETCAVEKTIYPTGADLLCFKDATSVYFATTGIRFRGKIANFGRPNGSLCGFDTPTFGVAGTLWLGWTARGWAGLPLVRRGLPVTGPAWAGRGWAGLGWASRGWAGRAGLAGRPGRAAELA